MTTSIAEIVVLRGIEGVDSSANMTALRTVVRTVLDYMSVEP